MQIREIQPTLDGDQPITQEAKLAVLADVGPPQPTAWIHLASWRTSLHFSDWDTADIVALAKGFEKAATRQFNDYARPFEGGTAADPPARMEDWLAYKDQTLVLTRPRLARADAPIVNYAGTMRTGTLGRVIGAIRALTCVDLVEPPKPVLVFVQSSRLSHDPKVGGWDGLVHLWGRVRARASCPTA